MGGALKDSIRGVKCVRNLSFCRQLGLDFIDMVHVDLASNFFGPQAQGRFFTDLSQANFEDCFEVAINLGLLELGCQVNFLIFFLFLLCKLLDEIVGQCYLRGFVE